MTWFLFHFSEYALTPRYVFLKPLPYNVLVVFVF